MDYLSLYYYVLGKKLSSIFYKKYVTFTLKFPRNLVITVDEMAVYKNNHIIVTHKQLPVPKYLETNIEMFTVILLAGSYILPHHGMLSVDMGFKWLSITLGYFKFIDIFQYFQYTLIETICNIFTSN